MMNMKYFIELLREYARSESDIPLCPDEIVEGFKKIFYTNPYNWVTKEYYADEIKKLEQKYLPPKSVKKPEETYNGVPVSKIKAGFTD